MISRKIFEYSGGGDSTNYENEAYVSDTVRTTPARPFVSASVLHFANITLSSVKVSCTPGNGQKRLFVIRALHPITDTPVDGLSYTIDTIFGKGSDLGNNTYAVADTGATVTITGLAPATTYYVAVFEFNGNGSNAIYLVNPFPTESFSTELATAVVNLQDSGLLVNVFPNPVQQNCFIQVQSNEVTDMDVDVFEISGKQVNSYSFKIAWGHNNFELKDFAKLSKGIYILYLKIGKHQGFVKVLKE